MRNFLLTLAFMLVGGFAFANGSSVVSNDVNKNMLYQQVEDYNVENSMIVHI